MTDISGAMEAARQIVDEVDSARAKRREAFVSVNAEMVARAFIASHPQRDGEGNRGLDAAASPVDPWQPISTAPKNGRTVELRAEMLAHYILGAKFPMLQAGWRPETPQTEWRVTAWRETAPPGADANQQSKTGEEEKS